MEDTQTPMGESIKISCERCRRRKIKCDRKRPCSRCVKAGTECILSGSGEKQRPISKGYVQALEGQVASLELLIRRLVVADSTERDDMLSELALSPPTSTDLASSKPVLEQKNNSDPKIVAAQVRSGQLRRPRSSNATQFFGGTSAFHIHLSHDASMSPSDGTSPLELSTAPPYSSGLSENNSVMSSSDHSFMYAPHDETSQMCMAAYFKYQYHFHLLVYREYFLRDYDVGSGNYYSDALLFAICALGAMQLDDSRNISDIFANQAQTLIYSTLDSPDLTTLQALALLGYREIGVGHTSKGWLFCGMAFRLAHEMGLHLDPNNWDASAEHPNRATELAVRDTEILRRVYWAIFIADKQLSLYFGRPPALHPSESDVRNTIRLQYPPDWEGLLDTYICKGTSAIEFEDGVALIGSFIYQAELCKIVHVMITELFENRRGNVDDTVAAARSRQIHVSLTKWLSSLPGTLHWNQWTVGVVQPAVLRMHMLFHTVMIILHRPPSHMFEKPGIAESEDVEICYESLQAILRLMRTYSRHYRYRSLSLDFVQTLSTAAGTVMMKRFFQCASWDDSDISRSLSTILDAMEQVQHTWPCVGELKDYIVRARSAQAVMPPEDPLNVPDLMNGLELGHGVTAELMAQWNQELGTLVTDEFLNIQLQATEEGIQAPFDFNQNPTLDWHMGWDGPPNRVRPDSRTFWPEARCMPTANLLCRRKRTNLTITNLTITNFKDNYPLFSDTTCIELPCSVLDIRYLITAVALPNPLGRAPRLHPPSTSLLEHLHEPKPFTMASSSSPSSSPYPFATAPDVIRAHQKDAYFTGRLTQDLSDLFRRLRGARATHAAAPELRTAACLLYYVLTTLPGNRTLGEEYCDLVQVDARDGRLPAVDRRAAYVAGSILLPYVAGRILPGLRAGLRRILERRLRVLRSQDKDKSDSREARLWDYVTRHLSTLTSAAPFQAVVLALFYFSGTYYELAKRLLSLRYVFTRTVPDTPDRAGYELLGVLLVVQLGVQGYMHVRTTLADIAPRERASFTGGDVSLDHDGSYNNNNDLLLSGGQGTQARIDLVASTHTPSATTPRFQLTNDKVMSYIKGSQQRKCTLCLDEMKDPAATQCGHVFCWECIGDWVREKPECPLCRREAMAQHILPLRVM